MSAVIFLAAVATAAEVAIVWSAAAGYISVTVAFLLHLVLAGIVAVNFVTFRSQRAPLLILAAGVLLMGPFGALGGIVMGLFGLIPSDTDFESHRCSLGPKGESDPIAVNGPTAGSGRSLISFHDVIRWGTRTEKQVALRRIAERYSPVFAGALKGAMEDTAPEIRSEAAAASNTIIGQMENDARRLADIAAKAPAGEDRAKHLIRYGDAEMLIARSGLATQQRARDARRSALSAYQEARQALPDAPGLHLKAAVAHFDEGALVEAAKESRAALGSASGNTEQADEALTTHLETLFALGRYRDVRKILAHVTPSGRTRRAAALWNRTGAQTAQSRPARRPQHHG